MTNFVHVVKQRPSGKFQKVRLLDERVNIYIVLIDIAL